MGPESGITWKKLICSVRRAVNSDAGFIVIDRSQAPSQRDFFTTLSRSLGTMPKAEAFALGKQGSYNIQVRMDGGRADEHGFLVYSTTGRAFPCHTDLYRDRHPADLLLMKCVRADRGGGRTIIYKLRDLLASLSPREISVLRRPSFPTEFGKIQLLSADSHGYSIRYNRREIDFFARLRREPLSARQSEVLNKIDLLLANGKERQEFLLQPGQCIVINNKTVLHGRTRLSKGTKRLLKRIRLPARPRLRGLNLVAN